MAEPKRPTKQEIGEALVREREEEKSMSREKHTDKQEHDPLHENMIRNRRRLAPGHWSNSDIDCLLRCLDEARSECDAANRGRDAAKELAAQWGFRLAEAEEQRDSALAAAAEARRLAIEECAPRWQPIDTAPKSTHEGEYVRGIYLLGYCPEEGIRPDACICVIWWEPLQNGGEWVNEAGASVRPTHWQPLPPAPEEPQP